MSITFDPGDKSFHLKSKGSSYVLQNVKNGHIAHIYYDKVVRKFNCEEVLKPIERPSFSPNPDPKDMTFSLDTLPREYPTFGNSDFRRPALEITNPDGSSLADLKYLSHIISKGKPKLLGLPATYSEKDDEATTLELKLQDSTSKLDVSLFYSTFENLDVITRWAVIKNNSDKPMEINNAQSFSMDFNHCDFDFMHLNGYWARERHVVKTPLGKGNLSIESRRGASGHHQNPFFALMSKNSDEDSGNVYGFNLVYSGNFTAHADVDQYNNTRVSMGINPFEFSWQLKPGESFTTPEAVMVHSEKGLGEMSRTFHELYRKHLIRGNFRDSLRPILINNWEATYFDFNKEKIEKLAKSSKELGIELFVLDDGWFGKRDNDKSSLGDWDVNLKKLPEGLKALGDGINKEGLKFGLWFEPEMISRDSALYREHPDWCLHIPGRSKSEGRSQLVLDISRKEVRDYILWKIENILSSAPIEYVKWDMNRNMTEVGSSSLPPARQKETTHRYILGLYEMMEKLTTKFPNILFESCAGGGGRFDPGILHYMPQTWTSDDTDAIERLKIQYGTSMVYPPIAMGAHVSAVPNHQVDRTTPLETRGHVAMGGNLGYELDVSNLTTQEKEDIKNQIKLYKEIRPLVQFGDFYRLKSPFEGNETGWMFVSKDKKDAVVSYFKTMAEPNPPQSTLKLKGLDENTDYTIVDRNVTLGGDMLMNSGITLPTINGDFKSILFKLKAQ